MAKRRIGVLTAVFSFALLSGASACDDGDDVSGPEPGVEGTWTLLSAQGKSLPARVVITQYVDDDGIVRHLEHEIVTGSIKLTAAGTYQQSVLRRVYEDGQMVYANTFNDRAVFTVNDNNVSFESTLYVNIAFEGMLENGRLVVSQDVLGEEVMTGLSYGR